MSNKISGVDSRLGPVGASQPVARSREKSLNEPASGESRSGVQITDGARQLAALEKAIAAAPVVDDARVSAVSRAIDDGSYTVQPGRIADKLLRMDQELGATLRPEK